MIIAFIKRLLLTIITSALLVQVETKVNEEPYATLIHNKPLVDAYTTNVISLGGVADDYNELGKKLTVSTDMGNVSHVMPTIHPSYSGGSGVLNHNHVFTAIAGTL